MNILLRALILALLSSGAPGAFAADTPAPVTDPAQVARHFHEVVARPEFQEAVEPDASRAWRDWLSQEFTRAFTAFGHLENSREMPRFASMLMSIFVLLSLAGLLYTLFRFVRRRRALESPPTHEAADPPALRPPEFYDEELRRALAAGNWSAAWLASWRQFLSRLEQGHLVEADRSNREYLAQLQRQPLPAPALPLLSRMVDAYDRFIYGCRPIAEPDWNFFREQVNEATLLLHLQETRPHPAAKP
jgi:hypothetical protein